MFIPAVKPVELLVIDVLQGGGNVVMLSSYLLYGRLNSLLSLCSYLLYSQLGYFLLMCYRVVVVDVPHIR